NAPPALRAGLAVAAQAVLVITHFADGRAAVDVHLARLTRLQTQVGVDTFASGERDRAASAARQLPTLAGLHLDVVNDRADRDMAQGHRVARLDRCIGARADVVTGLHALRRKDVATLAIGVLHERDVASAIRIVLEALDDTGDAVLVALEVDEAVLLT